eukprot:m.154636 g.154636  ORF g.154636 m.154636 type:complete len:50 (-) comp16258_c3_seq1:22-171(-)
MQTQAFESQQFRIRWETLLYVDGEKRQWRRQRPSLVGVSGSSQPEKRSR